MTNDWRHRRERYNIVSSHFLASDAAIVHNHGLLRTLSKLSGALREFRMKLLGLLPIASVVGLAALGKALPTSPRPELQPEAVGYIGIFSGILTLALFGSLLMCDDYSVTGARLEAAMGIRGQFTWCDETRHLPCYWGKIARPLARFVNDKGHVKLGVRVCVCVLVLCRAQVCFRMQTHQCLEWAVGIGAVVSCAALMFLGALTRESKPHDLLVADEAVFVVMER
jgi:hypothetical protein